MKKIIILSMVLVVPCMLKAQEHGDQSDTMLPASTEETFLQATMLYHQHSYEKAFSYYEALNPKSASVWYNMGNCYYHLSKLAYALACWRRAEKLVTNRHLLNDIEYNIDVVHSELGKPVDNSFFARVGYYCMVMSTIVSPFMLQLLILVLLLFLVVLVVRRRCTWRWLVMISGLILPLALMVHCAYVRTTKIRAVVIAKTTPIYAGPSVQYPQIGILSEADEVGVADSEDTWYKIKHVELMGWIPGSAVEVI